MYKQHPDATLEDVAEHIEENYDVTLQEAVKFYHECKVEGYEEKHYHQGDTTPAEARRTTTDPKPEPGDTANKFPDVTSNLQFSRGAFVSGPAGEAEKKVCMTKSW